MRIVTLLAIVSGFCLLAGCNSSDKKEPAKTETQPANAQPAAQPAPTVQPAPSKPGQTAAPATAAAGTQPAGQRPSNRVVIETNRGVIVVELDSERTPQTVKNFLRYVDEKFYDGTIFHRVIKEFMIQGGGFTPTFQEKPTREPIMNEAAKGASNLRGTIAMARRGDPNSATSQFFINTVDNKQLDFPNMGGGYCAFGRVIRGMEVVDAIADAHTVNRGGAFTNLPLPMIVIKSVRRDQD